MFESLISQLGVLFDVLLKAYQWPQLLGNEFGRLEFQQRVRKKHVGQQLLYRDRHMTGWYVAFIYALLRKLTIFATQATTFENFLKRRDC